MRYKVPSVKEISISKSSVINTKSDSSVQALLDANLGSEVYLKSVLNQNPSVVHSALRAVTRESKLSEQKAGSQQPSVKVQIARFYSKPQTGTESLGSGKTVTQDSMVSVKPQVTKSVKRKTVNLLSEQVNRSQAELKAPKKASFDGTNASEVFVHHVGVNTNEAKWNTVSGTCSLSKITVPTRTSENKSLERRPSHKMKLESSSLKALFTKPSLQNIPGVSELGSLGFLTKHPLQFKQVKQGTHLKGDRGHEISGGAKNGYCRQPNGGFFHK